MATLAGAPVITEQHDGEDDALQAVNLSCERTVAQILEELVMELQTLKIGSNNN